MTRIGFVLLTHSNPGQIARLASALDRLYDGPPIVCHHDFSQCPLDKSQFSKNLRFVEPHLPTFWGCFSIVPAALTALRMLMEGENPPDWIYLLSGSDYPSADAKAVIRFLSQTNFDAFIDHREIHYGPASPETAREVSGGGFSRKSYPSLAYRRYCAVAVPRPSRAKPLAIPPAGRSYLYLPFWRSLIPGAFSSHFRCYAGEHWFTVNARAAAVLLDQTAQSKRLMQHLRRRESPEECFYHSVLGNNSLRLSNNHLRYIDWPTEDAWHPRTLAVSDLPQIRDSGAHFVRKVTEASPLLDELDRFCGLSQPGSHASNTTWQQFDSQATCSRGLV